MNTFYRLALAIALFGLGVVGCSPSPEEQAAEHITAITEILEEYEDDPEDGVEAVHDYIAANAPAIFQLVGQGIVMADEAVGSRKDSRALFEAWEEELEDPLDDFLDVMMDFAEELEDDRDAEDALEDIFDYYDDRLPEMIEEALTAVADGEEGGMSSRRRRDITSEATMNVRKLFDSSISYYDADHADAQGNIIDPQFPRSVPMTPPTIPCGEAVQPSQEWWSDGTWESLNFAVSDPQYYSYQYDSSGSRIGSTFTASAFGDLDCDGVISTFVRVGEVLEGNEIRGGAGLYMHNELE